jgi:ribonuclease VapC
MILDTSAAVVVLFDEPGSKRLRDKIAGASVIGIGAPTLVELGIVLTAKLGDRADGDLQGFLHASEAVVVPFDDAHWREAVRAFARYGRGQHPAKLDFGDCLSYATAKVAGQPLLSVGNEFAQTDLGLA